MNETKAFLFDSTPDLKDAEEKEKFSRARRHKRRGAICYYDQESEVRR